MKSTLLVLTGLLTRVVTATLTGWQQPAQRERGLSQSTENAILLAGAVTVAGIVITAITLYVTGHMPKP